MANSLILCSGSAATTTSTVTYNPLVGALAANTTEANMQVITRLGGVASQLCVVTTADSTTVDSTVRTRVKTATPAGAGANGNQAATLTHAVTGIYQDSTHTDTVAAGNLWCYSTAPGSAAALTISIIQMTFAATTNTLTPLAVTGSVGSFSASTADFWPLSGLLGTKQTVETTGQKTRVQKGGTFNNMYVYVTAASASTTHTGTFRDNAADAGSISVSCTANTTGFFEDTTHAATVTTTHDYDYKFLPGATITSLVIGGIGSEYVSTAGCSIMMAGSDTSGVLTYAKNSTFYNPIGGNLLNSFTSALEARTQSYVIDTTFTMDNLQVFITTNGTTAGGSVTLDKNAVATALTATFTTATGTVSDTTHSVTSFLATDKLSTKIINADVGSGTHNLVLQWINMHGTTSGSVLTTWTDTETTTISSSQLRCPKPTIATETKTISETKLRCPKPLLATESKSISGTVAYLRSVPRTLTETKSISEALTTPFWRRVLTETKTISESITAFKIILKGLTETTTISEIKNASKTAAEWVVIAETQLRKAIPKIAAEVKSISGTVAFVLSVLRALTETKSISETLVSIATHFIALSDIETISETSNASKLIREFVNITETQLRKVIPFITTETNTISDSISKLLHFFKTITETKSISETLLRTVIPKITAETKSIAETILRTIIRPISESSTVSELLSFIKIYFGVFTSFTLTETIAVSDAIDKLCSFFRDITENISISEILIAGGAATIVALTETLSIAESFLRTAVPAIVTETISITDSFLRTMVTSLYETVLFIEDITRGIFRYISETISISDSSIKQFIPLIALDTTAISDAITGLSNHFRTLTQTITLTESKLRQIIPYLTAESESFSDSILRRPTPSISDSTDVSDSIDRLANFYRTIQEYSALMENVFGWLVGSIRRVVRIGACN